MPLIEVSMYEKLKNSVIAFILLSVLTHMSIMGVLNLSFTPTKTQDDRIEIEIIDSKRSKQQLIEQDEKALNDEVPDDAKFLGRHNQRVVEETKAQVHGDFKNTGGTGMSQSEKKKKVANKDSGQKLEDGELPSLSSLNPQFNFAKQLQEQEESQSDAMASSQNDYLKDVKPSLETMLNSKEFVYYTYYQRIRSKIRQHWEPSIRQKVRKIFAQGRNIASTRDHITRVIIILNKAGELVKVKVVGASGIHDIDEAAIEAFRAAEPFPNPPKGIIDPDGTIKINWDFILEA